MNLHNNIQTTKFEQPTVVTIGNFDGVHKGHEALFQKTRTLANELKMRSVVFTFANHPMEFVQKKKMEYLNLPKRKLELFSAFGMEDTVQVPFDESIMNLSTEQFAQQILLDKLNARHVVMGFDSRLGKGREGKVEYLQETGEKMGFTVHIVPPVLIDNIRISSSYTRELVKQGQVELSIAHLGRPYELEGTVIHGKKLGRKLGYPTANVQIDYPLVLPKKGVYFCKTILADRVYDVAVSVGDNPTIENKGFSVEGYILDFEGDLYDQTLRLYFIARLRDELKFESLQGLSDQLSEDTKRIRQLSEEQRIALMP